MSADTLGQLQPVISVSLCVDFLRNKGGVTMDIDLYQLIQQVAEMARQAAIDKAACGVIELEANGDQTI